MKIKRHCTIKRGFTPLNPDHVAASIKMPEEYRGTLFHVLAQNPWITERATAISKLPLFVRMKLLRESEYTVSIRIMQ